jgi:photosystem II stability/assembly factor-like uncharacterized protein
LGDAVIAALPAFLGADARVFGVDPFDDNWRPDNYRDQKYSFHGIGTLEVDAIQMGVAVRIPHINDEGCLWVRVIVNFTPEEGDLGIAVGEQDTGITIPDPFTDQHIQQICGAIFEFLKGMFADPVAIATAKRRGKIGFIQS